MKNSNKAMVLIILFVFLLPFIALPTSSYAVTSFDAKTVAFTFLEQVAGFNISHYAVIRNSVFTNAEENRTIVNIILKDSLKEMECAFLFLNGKFWTFHTSMSGELEAGQKSFTECLNVASQAVHKYQSIFNASYCSGFNQMILDAMQTGSAKVENQNSLLKVDYAGAYSTPLWFDQINWYEKIGVGFTTPFKSVQIGISKTGLVTSLVDNMGLFHVATTNVVVSEEQAISIAVPYIQAYANRHNQQIVRTNTTFQYTSDTSCDRGSHFMIYPQWSVESFFDKANNETGFAYAVSIWADNGKISYNAPQINPYGEPTAETPPLADSSAPPYTLMLLGITATAVIMFSGLSLSSYRSSKARRKSK